MIAGDAASTARGQRKHLWEQGFTAMQSRPSGVPRGEKVSCSRLKVREQANTALCAGRAQGRVSEGAAAPGLWTTGGASVGRSRHNAASEAGGSRTAPTAAQVSILPSSWERELPAGRVTVYTMTARKCRGSCLV